MASDVSNACPIANVQLDDEKEEGEISLEDVSSSEEGPTFKYQPKVFGQCPYCRSTGHCHTWCKNMTLSTKIFVRASHREPFGKVQPYTQAEVAYVLPEDAGKENRRHHHHHHGHHQRPQPGPTTGLLTEDLQPISSDSDLELVGLAKKKKTRKKKRRKRSPSFSISPETVVDQAIKDSIHREPPRRHQSPVRRKAPIPPPQQQQPHPQNKSPTPRKPSPQRMKKLKKPGDGESPLQSRGTVTKLLKKVKKLEPFSSRGKEKRSSLKDKLSNIIGSKKSDEDETVVVEIKAKEKSPVERREIVKKPDVEEPKKKEVAVVEEEKKEVTLEEKKIKSEEDTTEVKKITLSTKTEKSEAATTSKSTEEEKKPQDPEPDEDLQLRVIALRSAVLKKHRTRIARAKKKQQEQEALVPRIESPFTSTFNEDFPLLAEICNPGSPLDPNKKDIYSTEDMELDSDMEVDSEIAMMMSSPEHEANNIIDGDKPYSPTDELGSPKQTDQPMDLSIYTPSKPTETPMIIAGDKMKNDAMDGSIFESRPYSPSDATVYDPELPGVLATTMNPSVAPMQPPPMQPPPMQPPPMPPLGMMPMMPLNPMNLLGTFPMMPISGFAPVNPMLTAPFIPFTPTTAAPSTVATQLIEEFGETDLDGSPLVPIEPKDTNWKFIGEPLYMPNLVPAPVLKCNKQLQKSPPIKKPVESLFRNADMIPVVIEEENKASAATFKPIKLPVPVKKAVTTQPASAFNASSDETISSQNKIWPDLEQDLKELEELEEEENRKRQELEEKKKQEAEERKRKEEEKRQREAEEEKKRKQEQREAEERRRHEKEEAERRRKREREEADRRRRRTLRRIRQKSVTPAPRRRRIARTPSRAREIYRYKSSRSSRDSEDRSKSKKSSERSSSREKTNEKSRKISIDDDEQALREILLASLAKRKPNAKRKAALEAAKRKAAQEAAKTTSDKENIAEKSTETSITVAASSLAVVPQMKDTATPENNDPRCVSPTESEANLSFQIANLPPVLIPAILRHAALKRAAAAPLEQQQPQRKVVKRLNVIPASTRAVNNAKRYQNLLLQRKLTQQKLALYKTRFAVNNGQRSVSPQVVLPPNEPTRFVISLNEDTESESEADEMKKLSPTKTRPPLAIPTSDFEQSVDMFLKGVRLQQELTTTPSTTISKAVTPPIVAQATSTLTSKTITATTTVPASFAVPTIAKVAVTTSAAVTVPKVVATTTATATTSLLKERTVLNIPKPTTTANVLTNVTATPQALKHLPVSQQEEYRRLKQQIFEYEQQRLQKAKESGVAVTTASQASPTTAKLVNTSSSLVTPSSSPTVLTTSTPKAPGAKEIPKTQLIATISPMSKPPSISAPIVVTPTKIVHATANVTTKTIAPTISPFNKVSTSGKVVPPTSKPVVTSVAKVTKPDPKQLNLLSKITETLNSQKTLLNSAANKISSLRVLTSDQINQKTSQIQQKNNGVAMDDLNKSGENKTVAEKKISSRKNVQGQKTIMKSGVTKQSDKEASKNSKDVDHSKQTWDDFRQVVNDEVQTLSNLSTEKQKQLLTEAEEKLVSKRHAVLDDITEMSGSLSQWEVERDLQNIITAEILSLREQLRIAEEKLQGQKVKLQKIQPKVTLCQKKINLGRKECFRLSKICNGLGQQIVGSGYIVPTAGAELLNNRIKEVATHTQKLCGKKTLSVQSNNSAKTGKTLKSNSKVSANPNLNVKESKKRQLNVVDTETEKSASISKTPNAIKGKINKNGVGTVVYNLIKTPNAENIFNTKNSDQPMDVDNENSSTNTSVVANSEFEKSRKKQSTNLNTEQKQINNDAQLAKSQTNSKKTQESNSEVTSPVIVDNATATSMEIDTQCNSNATNADSNKGLETDDGEATSNVEAVKESNSAANTVNSNSSSLEKVIQRCWKYATRSTKNETLNAETRNESETPSTAMDTESESNTTNSSDTPSAEVEKSKCNETHEVVTDTTISSTAKVNEESESNNQSQIIKDNTEVRNAEKIVDVVAENKSDEVGTSSSILNNAFVDAQDKMEIENVDATRTDEQSTNSGPTTVITDNVESDSVNNKNNDNNTSSVVNTSLDDYMKEMTVSDEYDNTMCSKDGKSSASEHSTTFEEEIRLLELVSVSDAPHHLAVVKIENETFDDCQSVNKAVQESIDNCQSVEKAEQQSIDDCQSVAKAEQESVAKAEEQSIADCQSVAKAEEMSVKKVESESEVKAKQQQETDDPPAQSLPKKSSKKTFRPYNSILNVLQVPRNERTDGILCPFELMGTCIDEECRYIHLPTSQ